jgi:hypothetical protein
MCVWNLNLKNMAAYNRCLIDEYFSIFSVSIRDEQKNFWISKFYDKVNILILFPN